MDIKITCRACERTYPLSEAVSDEGLPGHCPFCREPLAFQYVSTFVEAADRILRTAPEFVRQLTMLAELAGSFRIEPDSVLQPVSEAISKQDPALTEPYRPTWPPAPSEPVS